MLISDAQVQALRNWRQWGSHTQRLVTAGLILVPLLLIIWVGPMWMWLLVIGAASFLGMAELERMLVPEGLEAGWKVLYLAAAFTLPFGAWAGGTAGLHGALALSLFCGFAVLLLFKPLDASALQLLSRLTLGWLYIPYLLSYVVLMGQSETGRACVTFTLFVMIANDAGAYYTGRQFGRRKLYERISPGKTVEGTLGGTACSLLMGMVCGFLLLSGHSMGEVLGLCLALAVAGPMGDLFESMMKRTSGIKDSGHYLPGHGGILDRLDSLLFAFPIAWLILL